MFYANVEQTYKKRISCSILRTSRFSSILRTPRYPIQVRANWLGIEQYIVLESWEFQRSMAVPYWQTSVRLALGRILEHTAVMYSHSSTGLRRCYFVCRGKKKLTFGTLQYW